MRISDWSSDVCSSDLVYGVFGDDGNEARRDLPSDPPATKWCVSIHTTNPQLWMIDYGDYTSPDVAVAAAQKVFHSLKNKRPGQVLNFIDEVTDFEPKARQIGRAPSRAWE